MINNYVIRDEKEKIDFFENLTNFLVKKQDKYNILVYLYIFNTCFYFYYCNDSIKLISQFIGIGTEKTSQALEYLIKNNYISDKPYMILKTKKIFKD